MTITFTKGPDGRLISHGHAMRDPPRNLNPDEICGVVHNFCTPRVDEHGLGIQELSYHICVAPPGNHGKHPLAYCFASATPCQVLVHAPLKGDCTGVERDRVLEMMVAGRKRAQRYKREAEQERRGTLDFYGGGFDE